MKNRIVLAIFWIATLLANCGFASNVTGTIKTPGGIGVSNGTLTFALSQSGIVAGSFAVTASPASCYTSTDGSIVGLPNPVVAPAASAVGGGTIGAGTYYIKITYYGSGVETLASPPYTLLTVGTGSIQVVGPTLQPTGATGYKIYAGTTQGAEKLQSTVTGFATTTFTSLLTATALPASNNSVCAVQFNDTIIPAYTYYRTQLVNVNGGQISGFPQNWYLSGASVDVSNVYPVASVTNLTRFPTPLIQNPSASAQQSVNSPVTLNGYALTAGSLLLPNNLSPAACSTGRTVIWTDNTGTAKACENGGGTVNLLGGTNGWVDAGNTVHTTTLTDMVIAGLASSDLAGSASGNGSIAGKYFVYGIDAATNAHVASLGILSGTSEAVIASGVSGSQATGYPLIIKICPAGDCSMLGTSEAMRFEVGGRISMNLPLGTDYVAGAVLVGGSIVQLNSNVNAQGLELVSTGGGGGRSAIRTTASGAATAKRMAFDVGATEAATFDTAGNLVVGATSVETATVYPIEAYRDQNTIDNIYVRNNNTSTLATAGFLARTGAGGSGITLEAGVTSTGFTPTGGLVAQGGFVRSGSGAGGLVLQSGAGTVKVQPGGTTTEATFTVGTGLTLAHALPVTSGGTGNTGAWDSGGILFGSSTSVTATNAKLTWDNTNFFEKINGGLAISAATRVNPAGGTSYLHMFYDTVGPSGVIVAVDYTGPTYKPLALYGSTITMSPGGTQGFYFVNSGGYVGPQWAVSTNSVAGATTLSLDSLSFPGSVGGIPYTFLKAMAQDGTVVWIPAFK